MNVTDILNEIFMLKKYMEKMHFSHSFDCISKNKYLFVTWIISLDTHET